MKNLIKTIFVLLLLVFANCIHAQNACEFDSSYSKEAQGHRILETESGNYLLVTLSGFDANYRFADKLLLQLALIDKCGNQIWRKNIDSIGSGNGNVIGFYRESINVLLLAVNNLFEGTTLFFKIDSIGNVIHKWKNNYVSENFQTKNILKINSNKYLTIGYLVQNSGNITHANSQIVMTDTFGSTLLIKKIYVDSNSKGQIFNGYKLSNNNILLLGSEDSSLMITYIDTSLTIKNIIKVSGSKNIERFNEYIVLRKNNTQILYSAPVSSQGVYMAKLDLLGNLLQEKTFPSTKYGKSIIGTENIYYLSRYQPHALLSIDSGLNINKIDTLRYPQPPSIYDGRAILDYIITNDSSLVFIGSIEYTRSTSYRTTVNVFKQSLFNKIKTITIIGANFIDQKNGLLQLTAAILPTNAANQQVIWSISDTNLATINQTGLVTAKANGTVVVTATAADGGGATATKTITITNQTVGINEVNLNNQITVYPNPASNKLIITTTNNLTPDASRLQLQLLDLTGKVIANYNNQTEIDISAIANGMYLLHIQTPNRNVVKQVVVNK